MLLLDVDAVCKLANWRLLDELPKLTGIAPAEMRTVSSLIHRAKRSIEKVDERLFVDCAAAGNTVEFLQHTSVLPESDPVKLAIFQDVTGIDVGEAILFSIMLQYPEYKLLTGDKRALRALSNVPKSIRDKLAGRVICLEQIVAKALQTNGLDQIRKKVCPYKNIDRSIANAMGSYCDANQGAVEEGLNSYIDELCNLYDPSVLMSFS